MDKILKNIVKSIIGIGIIIIFIMLFKIIINNNFINNYPLKEQEYRLKLNSIFNFYEPYVNYYNYGNYYYQKEMYQEALEKYKKAQEFQVPDKDYCKIKINTSLALIKQVNENDLIKKKELLEEASKYINECLNLEIKSSNNFSIIDILLVIIIVIIIILVILTIIIKKNDGLIPLINKEYLNKLELLLNNVLNGDIADKEAYYEMSNIIKEFVMKKTKINVMNFTKDEIDKIGIKDLSLLMDEYYPAMFSKNNEGDIKESINKTMEVIKKWNWK